MPVAISEGPNNGIMQPNGGKSGTTEAFFAGRLSKPMSELLRQNHEQPRLAWETKNLSSVIQVDCAHVIMLSQVNLISREQAGAILTELEKIKSNGSSGFSTEAGYGSIVLQIERILATRLGEDTAGRISIARSRLDQGATVWRIVHRQLVLDTLQELLSLQEALLTNADKYRDILIISYTHLQQAQPATFGHYLLAFKDRFKDSFDQLVQVLGRIDRNPLGAVGLAGTDLPIDREYTTELLGFSTILQNSRLGRDAYYQIEIATSLAYMLTLLNDFCTDLHIWSSIEFGFIELDDSHCSTSSIFPQKKNPYALETIKKAAAEAHGWTATALATFRNEGSGDSGPRNVGLLDGAFDTTNRMLRLMTEVTQGLVVHGDRCEEQLEKAWVTTNRLGNLLLTKYDFSYRKAHGVVARLVKECLFGNTTKANVTIDLLQKAARSMGSDNIHMTQAELTEALDHVKFVENNISLGGVGPHEFERMLQLGKAQHNTDQSLIENKKGKLIRVDQNLAEAIARIRTMANTMHSAKGVGSTSTRLDQ